MRVCNVRVERPPGLVYVGRRGYGFKQSALANPFRLADESERDAVVEQYRAWLWQKVRARDAAVMAALAGLGEDAVLGCWCHPKACHADVVIRAWHYCKREGLL